MPATLAEVNDVMGYDWGLSWGWMGIVGMLFMVVFWVAVVAGAVWLVSSLSRQRDASPGAPRQTEQGSALQILEERLARGEIDVDEFRSRRSAIQERPR